MNDKQTPLAVVGIGCLFPKASNLAEFWANIKHRVDGITEIPASHWSPEKYFAADKSAPDMTYARRGGFLKPVEFDAAEFGISPNTLEATDSAQLLGLVAAQMALRDAGYGPEKEYDKNQVSVILGVTGTLELVIPLGARLGHPIWREALEKHGITGAAADSIVQSIKDGYVPWQEASFPGLLVNVVAGRIANRFNFGGTNCVVDAACASSLSAVHLAALELQSGRSKMVITGGADCFNDIFMYMCFSKTPALSPTGDAKPFDKKADGTILGEGLGMVVLKRLDDAERDGDRIYAVLKGVGSSSDGRGKSIYAPSAEGQVKALRKAYDVAGVSPATVELVEAHGTGTSVGDGVEVEALKKVYGEAGAAPASVALGSVKSMIGHTKAAAGSAALIKAALALYHKTLPPTIKCDDPLPVVEGSPFYVNALPRPWLRRGHPRRAAVSALGFGGSNFHAVLEEHRGEKTSPDWDGWVQVFAVSAADAAELSRQLDQWAKPMTWDEVRVSAHRSRQQFKSSDAMRLGFVVEKDKTDLPKLINAMKAALAKGQPSFTLPDGAYFDSGKAGKLAVLFAGQGSQYVGMGRDLACLFPEALGALAAADEAFGGDARLSDLMYPPPAFAKDAQAAQEAALRSTDVAQPALGAAALSQWRALSRFGVAADAFAGHSYGELAALCAAGRMSEAELHALSGLRGSLMKQGDGGRGAMLAVAAALSDVERALAEEKLDLVVANKNAPEQNVLSGRKEEVERAAAVFAARGVKTVLLPVSAAFHSSFVASAVPKLRSALEQLELPAGAPVYANKTAAPYPDAAAPARELLASQLSSPVEFTAMISRMSEDGVTRFVELGPGARLTGLVGRILKGRTFAAAALDASGGQRDGVADLARLLAQLAAWGRPVDLTPWQDGEAGIAEILARKKAKMPVTLTGANYRSSKPAPRELVRPALGSDAAPAAASTPAPASAAASSDAFVALQRLQEQTARLHQQFLENQMASAQAFAALVSGRPMPTPTVPVAAAAPAPATYPQTVHAGQFGDKFAPVAAAAPVAMPPVTYPQTGHAAQSVDNSVEPVVLAVVAEKTGYPVETLNADMDLESDLGIDSIKRVEIMSALAQKLPDAPKAKPEHLGTLRTLRKIVEFLSPAALGPVGAPQAAPRNPASQPSSFEPIVLSVVAEKTGYPVETLNADMDLESDLGIDSIKRVEIMSALAQQLPNAPKAKPEHLGTLRTLRKIVEFLSPAALGPVGAPQAAPRNPASQPPSVEPIVLSVVAEKTGYPVETLNADMDLEADLGIDSIKRVEIMSALAEKIPGAPKAKPEHLGTLRTLRKIVEFVGQGAAAPSVPAPAPASVAQEARATVFEHSSARLSRLIVKDAPLSVAAREKVSLRAGARVAVLGDEKGLGAAVSARLRELGFAAQAAAIEAVPAERPEALILVAPAKRLSPNALWDDASEAFARAAFDAARRAKPTAVFATVSRLDGAFGASGLTAEQDPISGALAGLAKTAGKEWSGVACKALDAGELPEAELARLIVEELLLAGPDEVGLSAQGKRVLVAEEHAAPRSTPAPFEAGDLVLVTGGARGVTAAAALALAKACRPTLALWGRTALDAQDPGGSEAELKKRFGPAGRAQVARVLAQREIVKNLRELEAAGAKAVYQAVDVREEKAVAAALEALQAEHGPVRGIVHGAGVLADKKIEDKTVESFDAVWQTKVAGLRNVLRAVELSRLKALGLFSSSTARYGRLGQSDYAMANEALNKIARLLSRRLPGARVVALGWGPWDGGMVTDSLKPLFAAEGVGLIGLQAGGELLVSELSSASRAVELVVLAQTSKQAGSTQLFTSVLERSVTVEEWPILRSHVIAGRAVVPAALMLELMSHAALHGQPGLRFAGVDDLRVLKGLGAPGAARAFAGKAKREGGLTRVPVELRGEGQTRFASATICLADAVPAAPAAGAPIAGKKAAGDIYGETLFHGAEMRFIESVTALSESGIEARVSAAKAPKTWLARPWRDRWLADPAALDAAFQAMIVWTKEAMGAPSLPSRVGKYRQYGPYPSEGISVRCRARRLEDGLAGADIDFVDADGRLVARLEGYECTVDASLQQAFGRREIAA